MRPILLRRHESQLKSAVKFSWWLLQLEQAGVAVQVSKHLMYLVIIYCTVVTYLQYLSSDSFIVNRYRTSCVREKVNLLGCEMLRFSIQHSCALFSNSNAIW